jgi:hypothetical protein
MFIDRTYSCSCNEQKWNSRWRDLNPYVAENTMLVLREHNRPVLPLIPKWLLSLYCVAFLFWFREQAVSYPPKLFKYIVRFNQIVNINSHNNKIFSYLTEKKQHTSMRRTKNLRPNKRTKFSVFKPTNALFFISVQFTLHMFRPWLGHHQGVHS